MQYDYTNPNQLLNQNDAASFLGVKPQTLEVWRSTKRYSNLKYIVKNIKMLEIKNYSYISTKNYYNKMTIGDKIRELQKEETRIISDIENGKLKLAIVQSNIALLKSFDGDKDIESDIIKSKGIIPSDNEVLDVAIELIVTKKIKMERLKSIATELRRKGFDADNLPITKILEDSGLFVRGEDKIWRAVESVK